MPKYLKLIIIAGMLISITACAGALPWNKQNYAGINSVHFKWCEAGENYQPCDVEIINGKEYGAIEFKFEMPDGSILNFAADDVRAFAGQALRAEVEKLIAEQVGDVSKGVLDSIMSLIKPRL